VKLRDSVDLVLLAALWGESFLFMRMTVHDFGPVPLIELRVGIAALFLLPILWLRGGLRDLAAHARPIFVVGAVNSAIPFTLFAYAMLSVTAGFASILNATSPLFGAAIAYLWLKDRLSPGRIAGLVAGFLGVVVLVWDKASFNQGGSGLAVLAALAGAIAYGVAANFTKRRLTGVNPLVIATGSQVGAALLLLPLAAWRWPAQAISWGSWLAVLVLGVASTGVGYILYFRLIANVGPTRAIAVTFLIPAFGMLFGVLFLSETVSAGMLAGCAVILIGTALTTGLLGPGAFRLRISRPPAG
jgi:drug/metabolite transporter (DMT)-like permease